MNPTLQSITNGRIVWDNHSCLPLRPGDHRFIKDLAAVRSSGVTAITLNVACGAQAYSELTAIVAWFSNWIAKRPDHYCLIRSVRDVDDAHRTGRLGICFDVEGADVLDGDLGNVQRIYELGVRWMLLTYNRKNAYGYGCMDDEDGGLTLLGHQLIEAMNEAGMVVCASHASYRTAREIIDASCRPVIFSHSNARSLWDHPRNIPDDLIRACAARGGVIGVNGFGPFLGGERDRRIERFVAQLSHMLDLVGEDHVGLALDYVCDGDELAHLFRLNPGAFPDYLHSDNFYMIAPWELPLVAELLEKMGMASIAIDKILGGNHRRIAEAIWL